MAFVKSIPELEEGVSRVMQQYPEQSAPLFQLAETLLRSGNCSFSTAERELIATYASGINNCTYCYNTHKATAEALGIDADLLDKLIDEPDSSPVDEKLLPVLRFVKKLTETPANMRQTDADEIFAAGWDEQSFHFAVMICAMFNMMNRIMDGYGIENTAEFRQAQGRMLADRGYLSSG